MYDKTLVIEILNQIFDSSKIVLERFSIVDSVDYFMDTPQGREKLDAICMQLIAIGESLKKIDKLTNKKLLSTYPQVDWKGAKGIRDIISHHYFDLDAEEIYNVCDTKLQDLSTTIQTIISDLNN